MLKIFMVIFSLLLIYLQYHLWIGKDSYQEYNALKKMIAQQQQENMKLKTRNDMFKAEVNDLKNGLESIEEHARLELGMIKRGEVFYQIVD
ncbi:Septum formation initiator [Beggiatoa sp. PS]|nr:Septum formation initiator [Beggiatoa sp. PS]